MGGLGCNIWKMGNLVRVSPTFKPKIMIKWDKILHIYRTLGTARHKLQLDTGQPRGICLHILKTTTNYAQIQWIQSDLCLGHSKRCAKVDHSRSLLTLLSQWHCA